MNAAFIYKTMKSRPEAKKLGMDWRRDRSIYTAEELRDRWTGDEKIAINRILDSKFEKILSTHNPIYYLAERVFFDRVLDNPKYLYPLLHRDIFCKNLVEYLLDDSSEILGLLFNAPRFSYKTTFFHGPGPMWVNLRWKEMKEVDANQILIHHKEQKASRNLVRLKLKYLFHDWLRMVWPEYCPPRKKKDWGTKTEFTLPNVFKGEATDPSFEACGLGASQVGGHYHVRWHDDLVTEDHIKSKVVRDDAKLKYGANRFTMDIVEGKEVNSGTPYHVNDLWATMRKQPNPNLRYHCIIIPGKAEDGTLAHPYRLPEDALERKRQECIARDGNDLMYFLQYQCEARSSHLIATQPHWLRSCKFEDFPQLQNAWKCLIIDPAWKGMKNQGEGCFAAGGVHAFIQIGNVIKRFLLDGFYSNEMTSVDAEQETIKLCNRWGFYDVAPEDNFDKGFGVSLQKSASDKGLEISLVELKDRYKSKDDRIVAWLRHVQVGHYFIVEDTCPSQLKQALRDQHDDFPQSNPRDAIDMAAYSNDENVLSYVPLSIKPQYRWWESRPQTNQYQQRTRYTSI